MYTGLLHTHSGLRYVILFFLLAVLLKSLYGWAKNTTYGKLDNGLSLGLFISAHLQLVLGFILYFVSPNVQFSAAAMSEKTLRYWTLEHWVMMLIAIVLITLARTGVRRIKIDDLKHRRLFLWNFAALLIIVAAIFHSGRSFFG
jgi:hypothetical protein